MSDPKALLNQIKRLLGAATDRVGDADRGDCTDAPHAPCDHPTVARAMTEPTGALPTRDFKFCRSCGAQFYRADDCGSAHWARRKVCSYYCQHGPAILDRFWSRVEITATCWLWRGGMAGNGYGRFYPRKGGCVPAHVFAWEARLRPMWDSERIRADSNFESGERIKALYSECAVERNALRAALAQKAEALEIQGTRYEDDGWCSCGHAGPFDEEHGGHLSYCLQGRAALARPGVRERLP